ncbi:MAG: hypothetical protein AAF985_24135, partial [Bacteroidota bacterium]
EEYKWESQQVFQDHWDIEAPDFAQMYENSLQNTETRRLWKGQNFFPKEKMARLIRFQPDFARRMFRDLFDESKSIESRKSRFLFGCDSLLQDYKTAHPHSIENNHDHENNHIISMYLAFHYPQNYTLFFYPEFKAFMQKLKVTQLPSPYDFERFCKISRTLNTFLNKDPDIPGLIARKLHPDRHYKAPSLLLVHDFYWCCTRPEFGIQ